MDRLIFDFEGVRHLRDVLAASEVEQARFEADVRAKYVQIAEKRFKKRGVSIVGLADEETARTPVAALAAVRRAS